MFKNLFKVKRTLEASQIYELLIDRPYIFKWKDQDEFYCLERKQIGKITLIETLEYGIYYRVTFEDHGFFPFCDLPLMSHTFVPLNLKDKCIEYFNHYKKYPILNILE